MHIVVLFLSPTNEFAFHTFVLWVFSFAFSGRIEKSREPRIYDL